MRSEKPQTKWLLGEHVASQRKTHGGGVAYMSGQSRCSEYSVSPSPLSFKCQR